MGREIRRTPVGWVPPRIMVQRLVGEPDMSRGLVAAFFDRPLAMVEEFQPQQDRTLAQAHEAAKAERADWLARRAEIIDEYGQEFYDDGVREFDEEGPEVASDGTSYAAYYRPDWSEAEMDGYQLYEVVTEGTPVTPSFATKEELIDYLVEHGQEWMGNGYGGSMNRADAEGLVNAGFAMSLMVLGDGTMVDSENLVSSGTLNADGTPVKRGD